MKVRRLSLGEMGAAAAVHRAAFDERLPWLAGRHTTAEDTAFFRDHVFRQCTIWGAADEHGLLGIIAFREGWIDQLYVLPGRQRGGIGTTLLRVAQDAFPNLELWTFRRNPGARRFYERHGFVAMRETDGSRNEEKEPDLLYRWTRAA
jgi:GNAT superfamily N-acetyltransferase